MYLLDSSAIALTLKRLRGKSLKIMENSTTLDLARYELGNMIWKECALKELITPEEAFSQAEEMAKILDITGIEKIESSEDFKDAMKIATESKLTFYDSSYLQIAKSRKLVLVTEDEELREKAKRMNIKAAAVSELLRSRLWTAI